MPRSACVKLCTNTTEEKQSHRFYLNKVTIRLFFGPSSPCGMMKYSAALRPLYRIAPDDPLAFNLEEKDR